MNQVLTGDFLKYIAVIIADSKNRLYMAIGSGDSSWDSNGLPEITSSVSGLIHEEARLPIANVEFIGIDGLPSEEPTTKVNIISERFSGEEYAGPVRECGLYFGNDENAPLILYSVFPRINITPQVALTKSLLIDLI